MEDLLFIGGMRDIDPKTNALVQGDEARVIQAFRNMQLIAESEDATLRGADRRSPRTLGARESSRLKSFYTLIFI